MHAQTVCARCGAPCYIEHAETLLRVVVCACCQTLPEVRAFMAAEARWHQAERGRANAARARFEARKRRLIREDERRLAKLAELSRELPAAEKAMSDRLRAALQRTRGRTKLPD